MDLIKEFFSLYGGLDRAYGTYVQDRINEAKNKMDGKAQTVSGEYCAKLWEKHLSGEKGIGVIPITDAAVCNWGAIDIDVYPLDLTALEQKVRLLALPLVVLRTKSGGAHLTMYLKSGVSAATVRSKMTSFSVALGYGGVEIYPKQTKLANGRDTGNWLNMPYFNAAKTMRYAIKDGAPLSAEDFVTHAKAMSLSELDLLGFEVKLSETFADGPPCLQIMAMQGVPEGARNNALFAMGVYTRMKYDDDWETELDALNREVMIPPLPPRDVQMIGRSLGKKDYFYPCSKPPCVNLCNKDLCRKRKYGLSELDSKDLGINLGDLVKVTMDPPIWFLDVEGVRIELDTEDLLSQERFRRLCVSAINKLPGKIRANDYEKMIREKLENVQIQEAPIESGIKGRVSFHIEQFFNTVAPAKIKDEIILGRHWRDPATSLTHFRGTDLMRYLDTQGLRLDSRKVWLLLKDVNATTNTMSIKGRTISVWCVKLYDDTQEALDIPEIPSGDNFHEN